MESMVNIFRRPGETTHFCVDFVLMDVILNRSPNAVTGSSAIRRGMVVPVRCYGDADQDDVNDYKFRTVIALIPSVAIFYCARERRSELVGVAKSLVPLDMSWLRLTSPEGGCVEGFSNPTLSFGVGVT